METRMRIPRGASATQSGDSLTEDLQEKAMGKLVGDNKAVSVLFKVKKATGAESWAELIIGFATLYSLLGFLLSFISIPVPFYVLGSILACAFATYNTHILGALSARLEEFSKENERLRQNNEKLEENLQTFKEQNAKLKQIGDDMSRENERFHSQVNSLQSTIADLETVRATIEAYAQKTGEDLGEILGTLKSTLKKQEEVVERQQSVLKQTEEATKSQERVLLLQLQAQCQFLDQSVGMNQSEYSLFLSMLPAKYKALGDRCGFTHMDSDGDGLISVPELQKMVDALVAMAVQS